MSKIKKNKDIELTKPKAKHKIIISVDKDESTFYYVFWLDKSGKKIKKGMILEKDIESWVTRYIDDGWIENK